jgi:hypothetical protein
MSNAFASLSIDQLLIKLRGKRLEILRGRVAWRGMRRVHNRAGELFRMAAYSLHHDKTPMGDYLRRMKSKLGPAGATTATAQKIAIIFYTMVKKQVEYDATPNARNGSKPSSNGRRSNSAIGSCQSKKNLPRNRLNSKVCGEGSLGEGPKRNPLHE